MDESLKLDQSIVEQKLDKVWMDLVGPGWQWRTLWRGIATSIGVGVAIGILIAFTSPTSELPSHSRSMMVLEFTGFTALWAIPAAFITRWIGVRSQRKMRYDPAFRKGTRRDK
jgi:hypothetical protein